MCLNRFWLIPKQQTHSILPISVGAMESEKKKMSLWKTQHTTILMSESLTTNYRGGFEYVMLTDLAPSPHPCSLCLLVAHGHGFIPLTMVPDPLLVVLIHDTRHSCPLLYAASICDPPCKELLVGMGVGTGSSIMAVAYSVLFCCPVVHVITVILDLPAICLFVCHCGCHCHGPWYGVIGLGCWGEYLWHLSWSGVLQLFIVVVGP